MNDMNRYDVIVIGAGVGGLSVATLLAQTGRRVLVLEQTDRVGGRALSFRGEEIADRGPAWYKDMLATQYTCLAGSEPDLETMIRNRLLDGYTLDLGYHAVSVNGAGYMLDFEELIGGLDEITRHGAAYATYYRGEFYQDVIGGTIDPRIKALAKSKNIHFQLFYTEPYMLNDEEITALERVSLQEWGEARGLTADDVLWTCIRSVATLFSTINNPNDISVGDIFRYFKHAIGPKLSRGLIRYTGGFVAGGTMAWPRAVARRFESFGGQVRLGHRVKEIRVDNGAVTGVRVVTAEVEELEFQAGVVVSNIPAQQTFRVIDRRYFPERWVSDTEGMYGYGSYVPYMGLNRLVMPEEHSRWGIKNDCVLPRSEGFDWDVYICWNIQSVTDPSLAPEGKYLYTAYLPITEKESLNKELVAKLIRRLPDFMEEVYPGFKASIDWKLDLVCWKLEGVAKSISQAGTQKLPVRSPHLKGLFFSGDTAKGYGVAMDCAIASGVICAGEILGRDFGIR
ncbi:MAG: NAD(P)/FAD-dependent oxidoreductase [Proteobacteria bacterium]|nr:NAD(P)/FAD-dependent oxidoreductase [Pseudomonadota bacterium]